MKSHYLPGTSSYDGTGVDCHFRYGCNVDLRGTADGTFMHFEAADHPKNLPKCPFF